jgi:hypothetical protein
VSVVRAHADKPEETELKWVFRYARNSPAQAGRYIAPA